MWQHEVILIRFLLAYIEEITDRHLTTDYLKDCSYRVYSDQIPPDDSPHDCYPFRVYHNIAPTVGKRPEFELSTAYTMLSSQYVYQRTSASIDTLPLPFSA
ncbi:hypothetical protein AB6A40_001617 [Gnathostoma spinigerum]|uniref:Uncharacterized protein n=1 Tax=Gnathostoma spinigerum TaxID=75299 RepID=A0ABD6EDI8_9BILA